MVDATDPWRYACVVLVIAVLVVVVIVALAAWQTYDLYAPALGRRRRSHRRR